MKIRVQITGFRASREVILILKLVLEVTKGHRGIKNKASINVLSCYKIQNNNKMMVVQEVGYTKERYCCSFLANYLIDFDILFVQIKTFARCTFQCGLYHTVSCCGSRWTGGQTTSKNTNNSNLVMAGLGANSNQPGFTVEKNA